MSLFLRIFVMNAFLLVTATALLLSPWVTVSSPVLFDEVVVVIAGVLAMLVANALLCRYGLAPLKRLSGAMASADLLNPGTRPEATGRHEMANLVRTFNAMLDRLENERATSSARVVAAQEAERRHLARDLHDEVGQALTAVLLQLKWLADQAPAELREDLHAAQETTRESLDELRRIARRLRPGVLEDLGLASALRALTADFNTAGVTVRHHLDTALPDMAPEVELTIYRVAQEALANAARHSHANRIDLDLRHGTPGVVGLVVRDNGHGRRDDTEGSGIRGMRERALMIGAEFSLGTSPEGGTAVRMRVPAVEGAEL
ncbi:HAMP domain-containing sensor histidine kinase [Streptomyces sp. R302]|uniref:histidine kinase n=1 Tax=unclassified Streptomyces TaxID=2593676 RepID=UPI00145D6577|nr:HAMP domain-containing sensor histidine kinase [Streptomyces sp. R301]NML78714.1 HAMP domain-containing sensor histidine kinase [Streptomyces sp. R302]